mmetsp:Transcript_17915/g.37588  ORF Transcript_17915/g.37588 Transcript_17915/m.37588 type:complete len:620 (+) Transcript_17915:411-2270(+)
MARYNNDLDDSSRGSDIYENDVSVASLGPLSLEYKPSKYEGGGSTRSRGRSPTRSRSRSLERSRGSRSLASARSRDSSRGEGKTIMSVYSSRSVMEDQADVVGQCVVDDLKEVGTWRTGFTMAQILGGIPVVITQIPEAITYAYIANVDPFLALQSTWILNILTSLIGGRPGLTSSVSGLSAIVIRLLVKRHGEEYIWYSVILSGFLQVVFSTFRIGKYLRIMPPAITVGLLNAICLLVYLAQLRYFKEFPDGDNDGNSDGSGKGEINATEMSTSNIAGEEDNLNMPWSYFYGFDLAWTSDLYAILLTCGEALIAMMISFFLPRYITIFPSTLVAIVVVTAAHVGIVSSTVYYSPNIDDYCNSDLPTTRFYKGIFLSNVFDLPSVFTWKTISAVVPAGVSLFCVSLVESMVALNVVDKCTSSDSEQDRIFFGQGFANCVVGFFGGMGGSALALPSLHGLKAGGVSSVSTFCAGVYMFMVVAFAYPVVAMVPLGAPLGVTLYLICHCIQWNPLLAFILKFFPESCLSSRPDHLRLAAPDLFATFLSSWFVLCSSIYGLAGYLIGMLCYACDPIGHAIVFGANENDNTLIDLNISSEHFFTKAPLEDEDENENKVDDDYNI